MSISIVIPLRDEALVIAPLLAQLQALRGPDFEVVVVEAEPGLVAASALRSQADQWLIGAPGRSVQLQQGADAATHSLLWFLHADSRGVLPAAAWLMEFGLAALRSSEKGAWGRFDIGFDHSSYLLRCVAWSMNARSRLTRVCTGDQGIWVARRLLALAGGWPNQLLMEDVELSKRLRVLSKPAIAGRDATGARPFLTTSSRRWRRNGTWRTIFLMWRLRLRYAFGADPADLHALYYGVSSRTEAASRDAELSPHALK